MEMSQSTNSTENCEIKIKTETPDDENEHGGGTGNRFYGCYLLTSLRPRFEDYTYIGFTVNPRRRIRQHNGEITNGAWETKTRRPWEMVLCVYGFPTKVSALQFEWAWQNPSSSLAVKEAAAEFKSFFGVANQLKLAYTMLGLPPWHRWNITINYFSTKYVNRFSGLPSLPQQMKIHVCPMDELPCYNQTVDNRLLEDGQDDECGLSDDNDHENASDLSANAVENVVQDEDGNKHVRVKCDKQLGGGEDDKECRFLATNAMWEWFEQECDWEQLSCCSPNPEVDDHHAFNGSGSPLRRISPIRSSELLSVGDGNNVLVLIEGSDSKFGSIKRKDSTVRDVAGGEDQEYCSAKLFGQIEVIDLLSPSPESRMRRKKGRFSDAVYPQFIDLS